MGIYALGVFKNGVLTLLTDALGSVKIYRSEHDEVISDSFAAALVGQPELEPDPQGAYEYAWSGSAFGQRTYVKGVTSTPFNSLLCLDDQISLIQKPSPYGPVSASASLAGSSLDEAAASLVQALRKTFATYAKLYGDGVISALSGGFDSRLILALLLDAGVTPKLFVYGQPTDSDVVVAKKVSQAMGLALDARVNAATTEPAGEEGYADRIARDFALFDGWNYAGVFGDSVGIDNRFARAKQGLVLNGSLGEVYRNSFYLRDGSFSAHDVAAGVFSRFDERAMSASFDAQAYIATMAASMLQAIGQDYIGLDDRLDRHQVEMIHPLFRGRYWSSRDAGLNQRFGPMLYPFFDLESVRLTYDVPMAHKSLGRIEARMIEQLNPDLAAVVSDYGYRFDQEPPLKSRLSNQANLLRPLWARRLAYRAKYRRKQAFPSYLETKKLQRVMDTSFPHMSALFHPQKINDPSVYNRVATMEYVFQHWS